MSTSLGVCLVGAAGRMGQRTIRGVEAHPRFHLVSVLERDPADPAALGVAEAVLVTTDPAAGVRCAGLVIDFSAPPAAALVAPCCAQAGTPYVTGSTGLEEEDFAALRAASEKVPVLHAANMSVGVNVLLELAGMAAARLPAGFEAEIFELHHGKKRDAPSGTALALGAAIREHRRELREVMDRAGKGPVRRANDLGFAALRGGDVSGEHTVFFLGEGERVELTHRATTPDIFVIGALRAGEWLVGQPPGRYHMRDVLSHGWTARETSP